MTLTEGTTAKAHLADQLPEVCSYTEWDPLEEVIVGRVEGSAIPWWHVALRSTMPEESWDYFKRHGGEPFPDGVIDPAQAELEEFVRILEGEGVTVRRPDALDHSRSFSTQDWESPAGLYAAMPRDLLLCIGNELIEVPMAWRCRYFEVNAYRPLLKEYFQRGARWTAAPKPELLDELFDESYEEPKPGEPMRYVLTEFEPTFDAADFMRIGRDIVCQKSHVTNDFGIAWLQRHLGDDYRIHVIDVADTHPMHIDATLVPLAPGKVLINPDRIDELPPLFKHWDVLEAPRPVAGGANNYMCSSWISMNVFSLDEERVCVEAGEEPMIRALEDWGFTPVPCNLKRFNTFGGGFHCATLDVSRRGSLQSYF